jgi:hypothetical protein
LENFAGERHALKEPHQSIFLQEGKPGVESLWPNFNLTDSLKNQNQCLGHLECLPSWFNFTGIVLWLLIKCFILKNLVSSKQGFPAMGTGPPIKDIFIREKVTLSLGLIVGSEPRAASSALGRSLLLPGRQQC